MRRPHEAFESVEGYSPAEELFNRRRRTFGLFAGPALLLILLLAPLLPRPAHTLAAILAMMVVLWVTKALPLAVTALMVRSSRSSGVTPVRTALAPFADRSSSCSSAASCWRGHVRPASTSGSRMARCRRASSAEPDRGSDRLRWGRLRDLDVDQQYCDDRDDVSDRVVARRAPDGRARVRCTKP